MFSYQTKLLLALLLVCTGTKLGYAQEANLRGNQSAPVTILVFSAFTCPYCAESRKILEQVQAKFPGKVNVLFKHFPLGNDERAYMPHEAAIAAAEQGKFWEMHDALFSQQEVIGDRRRLEAIAQDLKLDIGKFDESMSKHAGLSRIKADLAEANALKVKVTPTFYIGGYKFDGVQQAETLEMLVQYMLTSDASSVDSAFRAAIQSSKQQESSSLLDGRMKAQH